MLLFFRRARFSLTSFVSLVFFFFVKYFSYKRKTQSLTQSQVLKSIKEICLKHLFLLKHTTHSDLSIFSFYHSTNTTGVYKTTGVCYKNYQAASRPTYSQTSCLFQATLKEHNKVSWENFSPAESNSLKNCAFFK